MYLFASGGPQPDYLPANGWPNGHVSQVGFCKTNGNDFSRFRWCKTYGHATARPVPVTFAIHPSVPAGEIFVSDIDFLVYLWYD
jgi:hypothetical protein